MENDKGLSRKEQLAEWRRTHRNGTIKKISDENKKDNEFLLSYRIAGGLLLLNAALGITDNILNADTNGFGAMGVGSLVLGVLLLSGNIGVISWARFAAVAGAVVFGVIFAASGDYLQMIFQLIYSASLIGLLFGKPSKVRMCICSFIAAGLMLLSVLGFLELMGLVDFGADEGDRVSLYNLHDLSDQRVSGVNYEYALTVPPGWMMRGSESAQADNPAADIWLVEPKWDAHVLVIGEKVDPDLELLLAKYQDAVVDVWRQAMPGFRATDTRQLENKWGWSRSVLHAEAVYDGQTLKYQIGLFVRGNEAYQVVCMVNQSMAALVEDTFGAVIDSFSPALIMRQ